MPDNLESFCDLVETRAAQHGIPQRRLWEWALTAILNGALRYEFSDQLIEAQEHPFPCDNETKIPFSRKHADHLLGERIRSTLSEIEYGCDLIPTTWYRHVIVRPKDFDNWLKGRQSPVRSKKPTGRKSSLRDAIKAYVVEEYGGELPPKVTNKHVAQKFGASERTVRRALGGK